MTNYETYINTIQKCRAFPNSELMREIEEGITLLYNLTKNTETSKNLKERNIVVFEPINYD